MNIKLENHQLMINSEVIDLPRLSADSVVRVYSVPVDYRPSGYFYAVQERGHPMELPACSAADYELVATLDLPAHEDAVLVNAKAEVLARAIEEADELLTQLEQDCSNREIKTWDQQAIEAASSGGDISREMVESIALYRGIEQADLIQRINLKTSAYKKRAGAIIGAKQFVEDRIEEAADLDQLFAVVSVQERLDEMAA